MQSSNDDKARDGRLYDPERGPLRAGDVFYFGAWSPHARSTIAGGHALRTPEGERVSVDKLPRPGTDEGIVPWPLMLLDPMISAAHLAWLGERTGREGCAVLSFRSGWTRLGWPDRTIDNRPGSHSNILARGRHSFEAMLAIGREAFPQVMDRMTSGIVLVKDLMPTDRLVVAPSRTGHEVPELGPHGPMDPHRLVAARIAAEAAPGAHLDARTASHQFARESADDVRGVSGDALAWVLRFDAYELFAFDDGAWCFRQGGQLRAEGKAPPKVARLHVIDAARAQISRRYADTGELAAYDALVLLRAARLHAAALIFDGAHAFEALELAFDMIAAHVVFAEMARNLGAVVVPGATQATPEGEPVHVVARRAGGKNGLWALAVRLPGPGGLVLRVNNLAHEHVAPLALVALQAAFTAVVVGHDHDTAAYTVDRAVASARRSLEQ